MNMCDLNKTEMESLKAEIRELRCHNEFLTSENEKQRKQIEAAKKLEAEIEELRAYLKDAGHQNDILRAQLDIVHLIFGNR